jgi:hypothetical protein
MAEKITILSLEKTPEYIDREWATVLGKRLHLLGTTDWTQLEDNELTFESRVRWNHWRNQVRQVRRREYDSPEAAEQVLIKLENSLPEHEFIKSRTARQKKYHLDLNELGQAKSDAQTILKTLHNDWMINLLPESIHLIHAKVEEMLRYYTAKPKPKSLNEYPLLDTMSKLTGRSRSEVMEEVMNLKRLANETLVSIETHRHKFTTKLNDAKTIDEVIEIVKNMHGY